MSQYSDYESVEFNTINELIYDEFGRLTQKYVPGGKISFSYDENNNLIKEEWFPEGNQYIKEYFFDNNILVKSVVKMRPINTNQKFTELRIAKYKYYENGLIKEIEELLPRSGDYVISKYGYEYY